MGDLQRFRPRDRAVAVKADGNPEGKGLNGLQRDWNDSRPRGVVAKPQRQVLAEFFTSMLVLAANFKYQPVVGIPNYLYWINGRWMLSLIAPEEWSEQRHTSFAGTCVLQFDRTWTITPSDRLTGHSEVSTAVGRFYDAFSEILNTDRTLEEVLPFHVGNLPYYQRLNANALSRSIRGSVTLGDQAAISCRDWRMLLPRLDSMLLSHFA